MWFIAGMSAGAILALLLVGLLLMSGRQDQDIHLVDRDGRRVPDVPAALSTDSGEERAQS